MAQHYAIVKQESTYSKYGGAITKITLVGLDDRREYTTYIDPSNFNSKHWDHITRHSQHGFILKGLKAKKNTDKNIINADSDPIIAWEHTNIDEVISAVMEKWAEQDQATSKPSFDDFFDNE
jgi:hypothetical protein